MGTVVRRSSGGVGALWSVCLGGAELLNAALNKTLNCLQLNVEPTIILHYSKCTKKGQKLNKYFSFFVLKTCST